MFIFPNRFFNNIKNKVHIVTIGYYSWFEKGEWHHSWTIRPALPPNINVDLPPQKEMGYSKRIDTKFRWWDNEWLEKRSSKVIDPIVNNFKPFILLLIFIGLVCII